MSKEIPLFELAASDYGLIISPMLSSFVPVDDEPTAFDPHRHDYYGLFLLRSGKMIILVEGHEVVMRDSSLLLVQPAQIHQCAVSGYFRLGDVFRWKALRPKNSCRHRKKY